MNSTVLRHLTWEDLVEIVTEADAVFDGEVQAGRNPNESFPTPDSYYNEVIRRLRERHNVAPPVSDRYPAVLRAAESATGRKLTRTRESGNAVIRAFISYRLRREGYTYDEIAKQMGRDHATVVYLDRKMRDMLSIPAAYQNETNQFKKFEELCHQ